MTKYMEINFHSVEFTSLYYVQLNLNGLKVHKYFMTDQNFYNWTRQQHDQFEWLQEDRTSAVCIESNITFGTKHTFDIIMLRVVAIRCSEINEDRCYKCIDCVVVDYTS